MLGIMAGVLFMISFMTWPEKVPGWLRTSSTSVQVKAEETTPESEKRFEGCRQKLIKAQQLGVLHDLELKKGIPKVVVGSTFYSIPIDAKQGFADTVNCFLMTGEPKYIDFDLLDWQTGKRVARYSLGKLKMY